jgi:GYF domain 2
MTNSWNDPDEPTRVYDPTRSNSLPPPDEPWFISRDSRGKEQLSAGQIIELCQDGTLSESTLVWRDGLTGWTALGEVPELAQALRAFSKLPPVPRLDPSPRGQLPSVPAGRPSLPSLPSLPPPPSLPAPPGRHFTSTTTPPQRVSRTPSIIINERAPMLATPMPTGRALSLLTVSEPYSLRMPGSKRVGVWSLAAGIAALVFGVGLGAFVFSGDDEESDAVARALNLDHPTPAAPGQPSLGTSALGASPAAGQDDAPDRVVEVIESEDPPTAATGSPQKESAAEVAPDRGKSAARPKGGGSGSSGPAFDKTAANQALTAAAARAARCKPAGGPTGSGQVRVTYGPSGAVKSATVLTPRFKGTSTASCVQMVFRSAKVPAFGGSETSMTRSFTIQ